MAALGSIDDPVAREALIAALGVSRSCCRAAVLGARAPGRAARGSRGAAGVGTLGAPRCSRCARRCSRRSRSSLGLQRRDRGRDRGCAMRSLRLAQNGRSWPKSSEPARAALPAAEGELATAMMQALCGERRSARAGPAAGAARRSPKRAPLDDALAALTRYFDRAPPDSRAADALLERLPRAQRRQQRRDRGRCSAASRAARAARLSRSSPRRTSRWGSRRSARPSRSPPARRMARCCRCSTPPTPRRASRPRARCARPPTPPRCCTLLSRLSSAVRRTGGALLLALGGGLGGGWRGTRNSSHPELREGRAAARSSPSSPATTTRSPMARSTRSRAWAPPDALGCSRATCARPRRAGARPRRTRSASSVRRRRARCCATCYAAARSAKRLRPRVGARRARRRARHEGADQGGSKRRTGRCRARRLMPSRASRSAVRCARTRRRANCASSGVRASRTCARTSPRRWPRSARGACEEDGPRPAALARARARADRARRSSALGRRQRRRAASWTPQRGRGGARALRRARHGAERARGVRGARSSRRARASASRRVRVPR